MKMIDMPVKSLAQNSMIFLLGCNFMILMCFLCWHFNC